MDEMLASDDPFWHDIGESQGANFAIDTYGANDLQAKLDVIGKMRDQTKLAKVYVAKNAAPEVRKAARAKITEESAFAAMLVASNDAAIQREAMDNIRTDETRIAAAGLLMQDGAKRRIADELMAQIKDDQLVADYLAKLAYDELSLKNKIETTEYLTTSMAKADERKFHENYAAYKAFASFAKDKPAYAKLTQDAHIAATKGTQFDFATPILDGIDHDKNAREVEMAKIAAEKAELMVKDPEAFAKKYPEDWAKFQAEKEAKRLAAEKAAKEKTQKLLNNTSNDAAYWLYADKIPQETLRQIAKTHVQSDCRFIAAYKLGGKELEQYLAEAKEPDCGDNLSVGGLYLGMSLPDAYVVLRKRFPSRCFKIESLKEELASVGGGNDFGMNIVLLKNPDEKEGVRVVRSDWRKLMVNNIQLPGELVAELFGEKGDVETTGRHVFKTLGLTAKADSVWVRTGGYETAKQNVLKYKSMSGGRIYFALENAEINKSLVESMSKDNSDDYAKQLAFQFGCYRYISIEMGNVGTLILSGAPMKAPK